MRQEMPEIARLKIVLDGLEPPIVREVAAPTGVSLDDLHLVIQAAMGWENYHLYQFQVGRTVTYGIPDPDWPEHEIVSSKSTKLTDLLAQLGRKKSFTYHYDFGDDWMHTITVKGLEEPESGAAYPRLLSARGACPPEDCGGPWGYADLVEAIDDPDHEMHDDMVEWYGEEIDIEFVDEDRIRDDLAKLAKLSRFKRQVSR